MEQEPIVNLWLMAIDDNFKTHTKGKEDAAISGAQARSKQINDMPALVEEY